MILWSEGTIHKSQICTKRLKQNLTLWRRQHHTMRLRHLRFERTMKSSKPGERMYCCWYSPWDEDKKGGSQSELARGMKTALTGGRRNFESRIRISILWFGVVETRAQRKLVLLCCSTRIVCRAFFPLARGVIT